MLMGLIQKPQRDDSVGFDFDKGSLQACSFLGMALLQFIILSEWGYPTGHAGLVAHARQDQK